MKLKVDADSPIPLYHQIAQALRVSIEAGELAPGDALEPMRQAAQRWGVNIHTVRHAYAALAREGLVERSRGPRGTRVLESGALAGSEASDDEVEAFLSRIRREAAQRFGLGSRELVAALLEGDAAAEAERPKVYVVECSEWQCSSHAREIDSRFHVDAQSWTLDRGTEPPEGQVISTYFHYNDIRRMWPRRLGQVHFLTIYPDPRLRERLPEAGRVIVCERDESTAKAVTADLEALFGDRSVRVEQKVMDDPAAALRSRRGPPVLFSPRVWADLSDEARSHPRAMELRYVLDQSELLEMGRVLRWKTITPEKVRGRAS